MHHQNHVACGKVGRMSTDLVLECRHVLILPAVCSVLEVISAVLPALVPG